MHGGLTYNAPVMIDDAVLGEVEKPIPLVPLHQPHNLEPIRIVRRRLPDIPQIACFDTAFHPPSRDPASHRRAAGDERAHGVRRYGFTGCPTSISPRRSNL